MRRAMPAPTTMTRLAIIWSFGSAVAAERSIGNATREPPLLIKPCKRRVTPAREFEAFAQRLERRKIMTTVMEEDYDAKPDEDVKASIEALAAAE
jgi:hypothetical protein